MTLVAGVSASIQDAKMMGKASGPLRLNTKLWARGGKRNHAATIKAALATSAVGISHGGRATRRYSLRTAWRSPGTASMRHIVAGARPCREPRRISATGAGFGH